MRRVVVIRCGGVAGRGFPAPRPWRGSRALTLVEVVLAIGILAMAAVSFMPAFNQGIAFTREIRDHAILVNLGEKLLHDSSSQIETSSTGSPLSFLEDDITDRVKAGSGNDHLRNLPGLRVFATVRPSFLCENGGYEIIIRFDWEVGGRSKTFSLFTARAAPDIP